MMFPSYAEEQEKASLTFEIQGEVPEGWEVVELVDAPAIEKWIEMKDGEKKRVFVKPFGLKPIVDNASKFTVSNPLENASGQNMEEVLEEQNINLAQSEEELTLLLNRLKALLLSLPASTENQKES
ncbi:MAG: hypothetical protein ACSHYB_13400 [Roseibacillus sp.]